MNNSTFTPLVYPKKSLILFLLAAMLVGGLSLGRFNLEYEVWGFLGQTRYWLFYIFALLMLVSITLDRRKSLIPAGVKGVVLLAIVLHGYIILSAFWAPNRADALAKILDILLLIGILFCAPFVFCHSPEESTRFLLKVFWWVALFFGIGILTNYWTDDEGLKAFWAGAIGSSRVLATGILTSLYLFVKTKKTYFLFPIPLLLAGVVFSGNRGAFLALMVASLGFFWFARQELKVKKILFSSLIIITLLLSVFSTPYFEEKLPSFWGSFWVNQEEQYQFENLYLADRDLLFATAWKMFLENPINGAGLGSFEGLREEIYPHNLILNIASDGGMIGLFLFLLIGIILIRRWFLPKKLEHSAALCIGIFYFICSMLAGTYYDARFMWLFFLLYLMPATLGETKTALTFRGKPEGSN